MLLLSWPRIRSIFLLILLLIALALSAFQTYRYTEIRSRLEQQAFTSARSQAAQASRQISQVFSGLMQIASQISLDLTNGRLPYDAITERLQEEVADRPDLDGLAITFEPFVYDPDERLYQEYIYKTPDGDFEMLIGASYDYSQPPTDAPDSPQTAWYHGPLNQGPMWNEPFFATGAQKILIEYGLPFYRVDESGERVAAGVVTIDYSQQDMRDLMAALELGATGYGFVVSSSGTYLAHPVRELVAQESIFTHAATIAENGLADRAREALAGESVTYEMRDTITGQDSWVFMEPIGMTGWALGIVLNKAEFAPDAQQTLREQVGIGLSLAAAGVLLVALASGLHRGKRNALWGTSVTFAGLSVALIVLVWYLSDTLRNGEGLVRITSQASLNTYLNNVAPHLDEAGTPLIQIPTGVFVQAIQFPDPMSVTINGLIWQRYPMESDLPRGFLLPQRIGEEATIEEILREERGDEEFILWYIGVTLRQNYDPTRYPFDSRDITLRLSPLALAENVILTPDLETYPLINPRLLPGLDIDVGVSNWQTESAAFGYALVPYNSTLGLAQRADYGTVPELRFVIQTQRYFLGPFIAYLLPGVVAALMLFAFLMNEHRPGEREELTNTLNYAAALFFVIAVAHSALRDGIAAVGLTYMEHLYILLYIAIVAIGMNTFTLVRRPDWWIVSYQENLLIKLLYWPLMTGVLLLSTLLVFVYG